MPAGMRTACMLESSALPASVFNMPKIVDHEARREEIAETVARLIASEGLEKVTIQGIAKACGYTPGMVLHYYDNKESLLLSALAWCETQHSRRIAELVGQRNGIDALYHRLLAALPLDDCIKVEWEISLQFWSHVPFNPSIARYYQNRDWASFGKGQEDLAEAIASGEVAADTDPQWVMKSLIALVTGIGTSAVYNPDQFSAEVQERMLAQAVLPLRQ